MPDDLCWQILDKLILLGGDANVVSWQDRFNAGDVSILSDAIFILQCIGGKSGKQTELVSEELSH